MQLLIAADHNGYELKNQLVEWLQAQGHDVTDHGAAELDPTDDYPDYAFKVAEAVAENPAERRGIVLCGSGVGMDVAANKVPGIRAALIHDKSIAAAAQRDDNINVLALGADYLNLDQAKDVITAWLATPYAAEERFERRLNKISQYEERYRR